MMLMGGTNHSGWFELAGKGAAIQTFLGYGNGPRLAPEIAAAGRENVFVSTGFYCGGIDNPQPPMNASAASALIDKELAELDTPYADLLMMHHRCQSDELTQQVWSAMEAAKAAGKAKHLVSLCPVPMLFTKPRSVARSNKYLVCWCSAAGCLQLQRLRPGLSERDCDTAD